MQSPARIVEIATAYRQSATLIASIELRIPKFIGQNQDGCRTRETS